MAERILMNEYRSLSQEKWVNVELDKDNILAWKIALIVINPDSLYYGGYFKANMRFPANYPYSPPSFQFSRPLYHPNIYPDGKLCISILHAPGEDEMSGEAAGERWSPVQRVESVLLSIISLLDDAECNSPANVDAGVMLRNHPAQYREKVAADVQASKQDIPANFVMPTHESTVGKPNTIKDDDADFWADSADEDEGFGGSDTDADDAQSDEDDDEVRERESDNEDEDQEMTGTEDDQEEEEEEEDEADDTLH